MYDCGERYAQDVLLAEVQAEAFDLPPTNDASQGIGKADVGNQPWLVAGDADNQV